MMNDRSLPIAINQTDEKYISVPAQLTQNITETAKFKVFYFNNRYLLFCLFSIFLVPPTTNETPIETSIPLTIIIDIQMLLEKVLLYPNGHNI